MSENARRRSTPESHLIERQHATAPARAWAGQVRLVSQAGTVVVPGTWHLELPHEPRPLWLQRRGTLPLPAADDRAAWRDHLVQLVTLRLPGTQLRVCAASAGQWHALEVAAPTAPPSIVQVDADGLRALLGSEVRLELSVTASAEG